MNSAISYIRNGRAALSSFSSSASYLLRSHGGFSRLASFSAPSPPRSPLPTFSTPSQPGSPLPSFSAPSHASPGLNQEPIRNMKSMDYVRSIIDESAQFTRLNANEGNEEVVHIKLLRNNTFITVTDQKGNTKAGGLKASSGMVPELKGGPKLSRYVAEATSEHVGRKSREMGLRSVVIKVNGFTFFKKKRQAIMSFKEGFGHNIAAIEDTTRKPHNGCRLRKKRRI